jgi:SAM-dependent methyltransferase
MHEYTIGLQHAREVAALSGSTLARVMESQWNEAEASYRARVLDYLDPSPSAVLLDLGCDDGAWTDHVRRKLEIPPDQVHGLELVDERAQAARGRGFDVRTADLEEVWPYPDNSIDLIHANQVIEHVSRLDHFVGEVRRVLVPGGVAIVCTENLASWHNSLALLFGFQPFSLTNVSNVRRIGNPLALHATEAPEYETWQHVHVLTLSGLRDLFRVHGLTIDASWGAGYHPFRGRPARFLAKVDPRHAHFITVAARADHV